MPTVMDMSALSADGSSLSARAENGGRALASMFGTNSGDIYVPIFINGSDNAVAAPDDYRETREMPTNVSAEVQPSHRIVINDINAALKFGKAIILYGPEGVGKSVCADRVYLEWRKDKEEDVVAANPENHQAYGFNANNSKLLAKEYLELGLPTPGKNTDKERCNTIKNKLANSGKLLVFYNVSPKHKEVMQLIPFSRLGSETRVLILSEQGPEQWDANYPADSFIALEMHKLAFSEALKLINNSMNGEDGYLAKDGLRLYQAIGGVPWHLVMAADSLLESGETVDDYLARYHQVYALNQLAVEVRIDNCTRETVNQLMLRHLALDHPAAYHAICFCAALPRVNMPDEDVESFLKTNYADCFSNYETDVVKILEEHRLLVDGTKSAKRPKLRKSILRTQQRTLYGLDVGRLGELRKLVPDGQQDVIYPDKNVASDRYLLPLFGYLQGHGYSAATNASRSAINHLYAVHFQLLDTIKSRGLRDHVEMYQLYPQGFLFSFGILAWYVGDVKYSRACLLKTLNSLGQTPGALSAYVNKALGVCAFNLEGYRDQVSYFAAAIANLDFIENITERNRMHRVCYHNLGVSFLEAKHYVEAIKTLEFAVEANAELNKSSVGNDSKPDIDLANILRDMANAHFLQATTGSIAAAKVDIADAVAIATAHLESNPENKKDYAYEVLHTNAVLKWLDGENKAAEDVLRGIVTKAPHFRKSRAILGAVLYNQTPPKRADAMKHFNPILENSHTSAPLTLNCNGRYGEMSMQSRNFRF